MKKQLLIASLICFLIAGIAGLGLGADGDFSNAEDIPDVASWQLDQVVFLVKGQQCRVKYNTLDDSGKVIGKKVVKFINQEDDPETVEDETSTEFTQLIQAINNGDNIKQTITNAVRIKLGL